MEETEDRLGAKPVPGIADKCLLEIQHKLKCDKSQHNSYGNYNYRSKEDILEAVKPLAYELGCIVRVTDHVTLLDNGWVYIESMAFLRHAETLDQVTATGLAREPESKKGMDASQITGTAASYAGKRALSNLFALDDTKDADGYDNSLDAPSYPCIAACTACGTQYQFDNNTQLNNSACTCGNTSFRRI